MIGPSDEQGDPGSVPPDPTVDAGLESLRDRLGELQDQVELLGSQGIWHEPDPEPPAAQHQPPEPPQPPADPYVPPAYEPPPAQPYTPPPPGYEVPPPAAYQPGYEQSPQPGYEQSPQPGYEPNFPQPEEAPAPPPIATNGHSEDPAEVSARSTSVALVDAGPFDDLIQLRHFEDDLASLTAVRDVRVRRFGHGRASIEVGMTGPYSLSRELYRLGRDMSVTDGVAGDLVIDLAPPPGSPVLDGDEDDDVTEIETAGHEGAA